MNGLRNAQALYDRRQSGDREPRAEREFDRGDAEAPAGAIRCSSLSEAVELRKLNPGRIVIVQSVS